MRFFPPLCSSLAPSGPRLCAAETGPERGDFYFFDSSALLLLFCRVASPVANTTGTPPLAPFSRYLPQKRHKRTRAWGLASESSLFQLPSAPPLFHSFQYVSRRPRFDASSHSVFFTTPKRRLVFRNQHRYSSRVTSITPARRHTLALYI